MVLVHLDDAQTTSPDILLPAELPVATRRLALMVKLLVRRT
jgi:hypothetical protein